MRHTHTLVCSLFMLLAFSACRQENKPHSFAIDGILMQAEGPLFEGSNTVQAELNAPLDSFLKAHQLDMSQIKRITLKKADITGNDSSGFGLMQSISLQLASESSDMMQIAVLNPLPANVNSASLQVAGEQDKLKDIFKQKQFFLVGDVLVPADTSAGIAFKCRLEFDIESK